MISPTSRDWLALVLCIICAVPLFAHGIAPAAPIPASEFTPEAHRTLAQGCAREADISPRARRDHALIAHVTARMWRVQLRGWSFAETVRRHTMLNRNTPRSMWARTLPWDLRSKARRAQWTSLLVYLARWSRGAVPHPCPSAVTWSARPPTAKAVRNAMESNLVPCDVCGTKNLPWCRKGWRG